MKSVIVILLALTLFSAESLAQQKECKVNLQRGLNEVEEGKKAMAAIKADLDAKQKQLEMKKEELKKARDELEAKKMILSKDVLEQKAAEMQNKFLELQKQAMQGEAELKQKENTSVQKILTALKAKIPGLAEKNKCSMVYENSADILLYAPQVADITDQLIQEYNRGGK